MSNSQRFLDAYNRIDKALHNRFGFKQSLSFADAVRRAAGINAVVRKFEDDLLDFARLRNAIVHKSSSTMTIAEPHDDVTERFEHIAELIVTPPRASSVAHGAEIVKASSPLKSAIKIMGSRGYSNMPVLDGGKLVGVLTNKCIVEFLAGHMEDRAALPDGATVSDALTGSAGYYCVMRDCPVDEVLAAFEKTRKLTMIILTDDGTPFSAIRGVITVSDLITINKMLDSY